MVDKIARRSWLKLAATSALAQQTGEMRAVWDAGKAYRDSTATRERICINGLWRWQPSTSEMKTAPSSGWGYLRVPESWPGLRPRDGGPITFSAPAGWDSRKLSGVTSAWYQREISVPANWKGRRITLNADYVNSYAVAFIDGTSVGELRFPSGELDLTAACQPGITHVLSVLVVAMPLKAVMLSYSDSARAKEVEGKVARRGLCGDVWLSASPAGPRIVETKVDTSVRKWQISFDTTLTGLDPNARYRLRARIKDGPEFVSDRMQFAADWHPEKLWDTITPGNQYEVTMALLDNTGHVLDEAPPERFGFREFWIDGRDFYLNGTRIYLASIPLDNAQQSPLMASYEGTRATLQRYKSFGINFVYTHNYGCEPGVHLAFEEVIRACDDEGMLLSFSQPHFGQYDWIAADADTANGYARHAQFYVRVAGNHPSIVCYSTSHNSTGYSEDMNPDMIDGVHDARDTWALRNTERAMRVEAILRKLDSRKFVYHHASGNLGTLHAINFYANWTPVQEMSDWFEHWAKEGVKPVFTCEYAVPFMWDWSMYRGWYKGKREFGNAVVPWELSIAEWDAQFLGDRAYQITDFEKAQLRWEAQKIRKGEGWKRWDPPQSLNSFVFEERYRVIAMYLTDNFRAFRTWGVSATSPWDYGSYWTRSAARERDEDDLKLDVDWDKLQRPGPRPVFVREDQALAKLAFDPSQYEPTLAAQSLYRNYMPLLAYIGGKPAAFTSKDHNFLPGSTVEKQLIVINNSRKTVECDCDWSLHDIKGRTKFALSTGEQKLVPMMFELARNLAPGSYELKAKVRFDGGAVQEDSFVIDVMRTPATVAIQSKIALFDPKGESAAMLQKLGVQSTRVEAGADLSNFDTLIIGKNALTVSNAAPDLSAVRGGLKVIVFEQTGDVLEKRFGFRIAEYGNRWVFPRVPGHPLFAGIEEQHLRNWHGEATVLPPRLKYERTNLFNSVPTVKWAGIPVTRGWRCGNRGNVASALIEKPARGNFLTVADCGYSLQYGALVEFREGKGMVLFCQLDVTGRTEHDPTAESVAGNILKYTAAWKPETIRSVAYAGEQAGLNYLRSAGIPAAEFTAPDLPQLLIVGPGCSEKLTPQSAAIAGWLNKGGRVLAIGIEDKEANAFLPSKIKTQQREHISAHFAPFAHGSIFAGICPADIHNRDPRVIPLIDGGVLAENSNVVFSQLAPWQFDYSGEKMNVKRTFRGVARMTARLAANMGAAMQTPLLANIAKPTADHETRWLKSFYLDEPEEWDDPYRFFRW